MKLALAMVAALVLLIGATLVVLSLASRKAPTLGLVDGRLRVCPPTPNCVCSDHPAEASAVAPLRFRGDPSSAWQRLKQAVVATGGEIDVEQDGYLHARYVTRWLRFVDDVEFRLDQAGGLIHVRSASRVGHSDFGANRRRLEAIRAAFGDRG